jgi:hypothetical protein
MSRLATGLTVSTEDPAIATAIDTLEAELLRYGNGVAAFLDSGAATSDCALALALSGAVHLFALTVEGRARARPLIEAARLHAGTATERELLVVNGVTKWFANDITASIAIFSEVTRRWPADLISAKICHFLQLNSGDFAGMLASTSELAGARPNCGFAQGMHAFALEQAGEFVAAERLGRRAAEMSDDPWAQHAVAHVLDETGRMAEGRAWMLAHAPSWDACSSFMYTHNWWHAALFEIGLGDHEAALRLFDRRVWGVRRDCCQDQVNAVSLLVRFELLGLDVGDRWADLAPHLEKRISDRANAFVDLHYAYGLARAGYDGAIERQLAGLHAVAERPGDAPDYAFHAAVSAATDGMVAHARGDHSRASATLDASQAWLTHFGGSRTQRRIIDLIREDSGRRMSMRAGAVART